MSLLKLFLFCCFLWFPQFIYCSDCWVCSRCLELAVSWFRPFWKIIFLLSPSLRYCVHLDPLCSVSCVSICPPSPRLRPVPPVLLPERLLVPAPSFGREESAGPHSGCVGGFFFFNCWTFCKGMSGKWTGAEVRIRQAALLTCMGAQQMLGGIGLSSSSMIWISLWTTVTVFREILFFHSNLIYRRSVQPIIF